MTIEQSAPESQSSAARFAVKVDLVVIGAGQAGLSSAYHLRRLGFEPDRDLVVLDQAPSPGGAWQFRWPSLTLATVNRVHDLPGMRFDEIVGTESDTVQASVAVPRYYAAYEERYDLRVHRPVKVSVVCDRGERLRVETGAGAFSARGIVNATGTWETPYIPEYPGAERFRGRQLHTRDYRTADEFRGQHVVVVGGGISAIQLLDEISQATTTTWVTRREPQFREGPFTEEFGRQIVAMVENKVRQGLPPGSVASNTGSLPLTPAVRAMRDRGVLIRLPMFSEITETGIRWADGTEQRADVILWCTGFRSSLDHLAPLQLREEGGGITMTGRLATQVARDPRIHLVGYGPSASTIGANRAGGAAARELTQYLKMSPAEVRSSG
ncbi:NAD(P)-binding domain-containing protein [Neoaquamicrobium sediminum]|uniref:NAD(P)-binding domain-containing protein n=1 Tax=Neoaquamicrobium sediminum TaxID=1849104 RepID=UPI00156535DF|nr:NAD(P)-binding domain-containing protein [Mesorhizobium sediminum]NRC52399.1 NAD(P)/FAD-dependent oxidoreductase [Mesorhizobium sediminum]